tara:strand:- start:560 stop:865 length:306 start_codon:yes stop_codon:yes gene_type:complete
MTYGSRRAIVGRRPWNSEILDLFERIAPDVEDGSDKDGPVADALRSRFEATFTRIEQDIALFSEDTEAVANLIRSRIIFAQLFGIIFGERPPTRPQPEVAP